MASNENVQSSQSKPPLQNKMASNKSVQSSSQSENPFQNKDGLSDLTLIVEGKELHVHKQILALRSPVFKRMLFAEGLKQGCSAIPLKGKYDDVVEFLLQLYPDTNYRILTDNRLAAVFPLAKEYKAKHVRHKCLDYVRNMVNRERSVPDGQFYYYEIDRLLLYLWVCEEEDGEEKELILQDMQSKHPADIARSKFYDLVDARVMRDFMNKLAKQRNQEEDLSGLPQLVNVLRHNLENHFQLVCYTVCGLASLCFMFLMFMPR